MRHPILYAEQWWLRQRFFAFFLIGAGVVATGYLVWQTHRISQQTLIWVLYIPTGLLFLGVLLYYRHKHHLEAREEGLHIANLLAAVTIGYDLVRTVRVQPLQVHYPESRKRLLTPMVRPLLGKPALFIRLKATDEQLAFIKKKLGPKLMDQDTIAVPLKDPDTAAAEINSRLPERIAANLGGGRRTKRRR